MVDCTICSISFDVSGRTARNIRAGRSEARCALHRKGEREETKEAEMRRWWLDRFSLEEIIELAKGISPRPSAIGPVSGTVLTASAAPPGPRELGGTPTP